MGATGFQPATKSTDSNSVLSVRLRLWGFNSINRLNIRHYIDVEKCMDTNYIRLIFVEWDNVLYIGGKYIAALGDLVLC